MGSPYQAVAPMERFVGMEELFVGSGWRLDISAIR